jgi:hypothetical protein
VKKEQKAVYQIGKAEARELIEQARGKKIPRIVAALAEIKKGTTEEIVKILKPRWGLKDDPLAATTFWLNVLTRMGKVKLVAGTIPEGKTKVSFGRKPKAAPKPRAEKKPKPKPQPRKKRAPRKKPVAEPATREPAPANAN